MGISGDGVGYGSGAVCVVLAYDRDSVYGPLPCTLVCSLGAARRRGFRSRCDVCDG